MGKTKVFLDTNILISALGWKGKPRVVFEKCVHGELALVTSPNQIEELKRVMDYPKFGFTEEQKAAFISIVLEIATMVKISGKVKVILEDPDDDAMLETAVVGNADYLISADQHLLKLKEFAKVKIVTASEFLGT
ncbi:TPA: putative toxin-antitoxin system toxin component, PIN family [Candidatus Woesearchaeota archaeon]|nr:putative toxin-antitoxin system toxin component, PIN family [Candidatus Woesearchaeota archaeon]HIG92777.1 putative toxin-antitoxin system toxin component, PIN family [Candidatus Woesearchaeota archaeon]HIH13253.1 putative toxin-antitoxin system toxin component, PIN family [Candidatus Woesearchaeota archaeon]